MPIGWVIALALLAFFAGWFIASAFHLGRSEDVYREGYEKGRNDSTGAAGKQTVAR